MNAITHRPQASVMPVLQPQTFAELVRFAEMAANTDLMPRDYKGKPGNIMVAVQMGSELGLSPMQALQNIAVVNGRPSVWGDALLGLVRRDPRCMDVIETIEGEGDDRTAYCKIHRKGSTETTGKFSVGDAKKASLWGKQGPWQQYPERMMQMRARGFACRDAFPDVLRGLISAEEAHDIPADTFSGPTINARAEPARQAPQPQSSAQYLNDSIPALDEAPPTKPKGRPLREIMDSIAAKLKAATTNEEVVALGESDEVKAVMANAKPERKQEVADMLADAFERTRHAEDAAPDEDFPVMDDLAVGLGADLRGAGA